MIPMDDLARFNLGQLLTEKANELAEKKKMIRSLEQEKFDLE